jgi:hypothetical protein
MPEWLKLLLAANNALGFVDTLQALTNVRPHYERFYKNLQGSVYPGTNGLTIGLNPKKIQNVPHVLAHEFGHIAGSGMGAMGDAFLNVDKNAYKSEQFADLFASTVQFLRSPQPDTTKLNPQQALIANILLQQPIYAQHPINQARKLQAILNATQSPSTNRNPK